MARQLDRRSFLRTAAVVGGATMVPAMIRLRPSWAQGKKVPVGSLLDKTGGINIYGLPAIAGTEYAVAEINAKGGLLGKQLELIQYDTQSDIANFPKFAKKLILEDQVAVIHGGITSASRESFRPVIDEYKQLYFYNIIYEGGVCDKYVFVTGETPTQQMGPLSKYALKKYGTKAYTVAADYNFGHISWKWWDIFWRNGGGLEPVAGAKRGQHVGKVEVIPLDVTDFNATLNRIQEAKPDVLQSVPTGRARVGPADGSREDGPGEPPHHLHDAPGRREQQARLERPRELPEHPTDRDHAAVRPDQEPESAHAVPAEVAGACTVAPGRRHRRPGHPPRAR